MTLTQTKFKKYDEYKDSSVKWLGMIPKQWNLTRLQFVADLRNSNVDKKSYEGQKQVKLCNYTDVYYNDFITNDIEFMQATSSDDEIKKFTLNIGDIIITKDSESPNDIAVPAIIDEAINNLICGYHLMMIKPKQGVLGRFLFYCFKSDFLRQQLYPFANGITRYGLSQQGIKTALFPIIPDIEDQKIITDFLDKETARLNSLIDKKNQLIELLKEKRQAIISRAVTKGINKNVKLSPSGIDLFDDMPEHWRISKLKYLTRKIIDGAHFTPTYVDSGVPFLRVTDITQNKGSEINLENVKYIPIQEHKELIKRCKPKKGDLLLSKNGTIGVPRVIDWDYEFSIFVSLCLIKFNGKMNPYFAAYFFESDNINFQIDSGVKTNTVTNLHLDKIREFYFPVPTIEEQQVIVEYLNQKTHQLDVLISKIEAQIEKIKEYKQALISNAVTGKIDVRDYA